MRPLRSGFSVALLLGLTTFLFSCSSQTSGDETVEALLKEMTLEEKVGQMTQLTLQAISSEKESSTSTFALDEEALREQLETYHIGSFLNVFDASFGLDQWTSAIDRIQTINEEVSRLNIPIVYGIDAVHGHHYLKEGTVFPHQIGLAAALDTAMARAIGEQVALEMWASGLPWNFAPVLDLGRNPLWSRFFETFGEDPLIAADLGTAFTLGQQEPSHDYPVAATAKHFIGYGVPRTGKDRTPAYIPERQLRELHMPSFQKAIDAGIASVMVNSGEVNGIPVHADPAMLTTLLREEMGFEGVVVSDWEDVKKLVDVHRTAPTYREAVRQVVEAGLDMAMTPYDAQFATDLISLVREGEISEARIDQSVRRILQMKVDLGLFDRSRAQVDLADRVADESALELSLEAAKASMTLLKNNGTLPLPPGSRVALVGAASDSKNALHGSWSYSWLGQDEALYPSDTKTLVDAMRETFRVQHVPGAGYFTSPSSASVRRAAMASDVVVVAVGEEPEVETPGSIDDLSLPPAQLRLIEDAVSTGKPVVLVLALNRPRIIASVVDKVDAIVHAYLPGMMGAEAITQTLSGEHRPYARLPFSYPRSSGSLLNYDYRYTEAVDTTFGMGGARMQFEFGHGLQYDTVTYENLVADLSNDAVTVSVEVTTDATVKTKELVQVFVRDQFASVTPSNRRLRAYRLIELEPGETQTVDFNIPTSALSFIGRDMQPTLEPGAFDVMIDTLSVTVTLP
ncbi:MAG: beta-glucosidase [Bacteroidetes bacterium]|nr:beta-glucosidase [Bacteroidota bacterium]